MWHFFGSLEESYEALRTLEILGVEKNFDLAAVAHSTCHAVVEKLKVPSLDLKDVFFALNVNDVLGCKLHSHVLKVYFCYLFVDLVQIFWVYQMMMDLLAFQG